MWKTVFTFTFGLVFAVVLTGCHKPLPESPGKARTGPLQKITIACTRQPQSTLIHVAVAKGYLAAEGLEVHLLLRSYGKAALQTMLDGQADVAAVAETPVMFSVLKGDRIFVLASVVSSSTNNGVVARRDAGIAHGGDLKGKRVGFTPGTTSDFFLDALLTANGLTRQHIRPVPLNPDEMAAAIQAGRVDALSTWNYPLTQIQLQLGTNGVLFYDPQIYTENFTLTAQQEFVRSHPQVVQRLLQALVRAETFVARHPAEAQAIIATATQVDRGLVNAVWNNFNYRVVLDRTLLLTLEDETRWAMRNKLTEQTSMPDYLGYVHTDSLRSVKPDAVGLLR